MPAWIHKLLTRANRIFHMPSGRALARVSVLLPAVVIFLWVGLAPEGVMGRSASLNVFGQAPMQLSGLAGAGEDSSRMNMNEEDRTASDISSPDFIELSPESGTTYVRPKSVIKKENVLSQRFNPPEGYIRAGSTPGSFAAYLQSLPLKKYGQAPLKYDGTKKYSRTVASVVDQKIGDDNLQQCADTIMRLRAEYLYAIGEYSRICFHFVYGFECSWDKWRAGYRVLQGSTNPHWVKRAKPSNSLSTFHQYLDEVFAHASTLSLAAYDMVKIDPADMQVGDAFVRPGSPGHSIIIVDMALNPVTQEKYIITMEGMIPAQQPQITAGNDPRTSPWIAVPYLLTGKFTSTTTSFEWTQLMRFKDIGQD